jgi:F-type H+-transporting ATPase subunit c
LRCEKFAGYDWPGNVPLQCEPGCTVSGNHLLAAIYKEAVMKKLLVVLTSLVGVLMVAPAAFAQGGDVAAGGGGKGLTALAVAIGMGAAAFGCGLGQGRIASAACEGMARNPGAAGPIRAAMILGLVFVETLVLFTLAMMYLKS